MLAVNRTDCVNDVKRGQLSARRDDRFAGRQSLRKTRAANLATCFQNLRASRMMNRAVNSATAEQRRIRRVHDRLDVLSCDVANDDVPTTVEKMSCSLFLIRVHLR